MELPILDFNARASLLATVSADGHVKVWDVITGAVRAQRPADLSDLVSALAWCSIADEQDNGKRKKKRKSMGGSQAHLLAMGTASGKIVIFDTTSNSHNVLQGEHTGRVHSMAWVSGDRLFSGAADKHVFDWNVATKTMSNKWVADKRAVTAMVMAGQRDDDTPLLLSAGSQIVLWNTATREPIKTFMGHERSITRLLYQPGLCVSCVRGDSDDSLLNVWALDGDGKKPVCSFEPPSATVFLDSLLFSEEPKVLRVLAVGPTGRVSLFQHDLERRSKKPLPPTAAVTVATAEGAAVPVLGARFDSSAARTRLVLARGLQALPQFDVVEYAPSEGAAMADAALVRQLPDNLLGKAAVAAAAKQEKNTSGAATAVVLGAAQSTPKGKKAKDTELTLEEQIRKMGVMAPASALAPASKKGPKATSLAQMLLQAMRTNDNAMLEEIFNNTNERVVRESLERLPTQYVVQLLTVIVAKFEASPNRGSQLLVWARTLLVVHSSFLMSVPDLSSVVFNLYGLIETRVAVFPRLLKLSGRLELMLAQIAKPAAAAAETALQTPASTYREDDMEDEEEGEDGEEDVDGDALPFGSSDDEMGGSGGSEGDSEEEEEDEDGEGEDGEDGEGMDQD